MPPNSTMDSKVVASHRPPLTVFNAKLLAFCAHCSSSKECQKAHWAHHKSRCIWVAAYTTHAVAPDHSEEGVAFREAFGRFGLSSDRHQVRLVEEYMDVHNWALAALVKALLYKNTKLGHTHWDVLAQPDKAVLVVLKLNPALAGPHPERVGPARSLLLESHALVNFPPTAATAGRWSAELHKCWAESEPRRVMVVTRHCNHPDFVGLVSIYYLVEDTGCTRWAFVPVCRRPEPHLPMSDATLHALRSVTTLCVETTRAGFPMGALSPSFGPTAATRPPGRFVWIRGVWRWRPLFESWADYRPGKHVEFDKVMEKLGPEFVENPAKMERVIEVFRHIPPRELEA
ncbi:hypothetical protein GSI_07347 [Ganoderma sinense ZZ0214-1]|uniref:MYND-type domain-containing protein n=1 Tax=Ganoderma sinense ZZ0214-1 TaxID=1077348 RepID=A0A2G8SA58_9APHY|nr:hypothetical protein GSI_07347 [Ganoderma sinense ZZ0214-1]